MGWQWGARVAASGAMSFETWKAFYQSDLQSVWMTCAVPALFLAARALALRPQAPGAAPARAGFVNVFAWVFALETVADALATGPLTKALGWDGTSAGLALLISFVLLGDFRVLLLVFAVASPSASLGRVAARAARWTLIVPLGALAVDRSLRAFVPGLPDQSIWLVYELGFLALALWLRERWIPQHAAASGAEGVAWLRRVAGYAALYYVLWAGADVLVMVLGRDEGWLLRALPNLLYYGLFVPFVWLTFFASRYAATSASTQASR